MEQALQSMIDNMPEKTGKSLQQWFEVLAPENFDKHGVAVKFLKEQHQVTHGFANTIVTLYRQQSEPKDEDLVALQYQGKEDLLPTYQKLADLIGEMGKDVKVTPKKATVSFIRKHQFALVKPATKKRIDVGLKLKGIEPQGILEDSGPFGAMCTHRIQINSLEDINGEVIEWLSKAYEMSV